MTSAEPVTFDPRRFLLKNLQESVYHLLPPESQDRKAVCRNVLCQGWTQSCASDACSPTPLALVGVADIPVGVAIFRLVCLIFKWVCLISRWVWLTSR